MTSYKKTRSNGIQNGASAIVEYLIERDLVYLGCFHLMMPEDAV